MSDFKPDWKNFAKAVLTDWPTGDLDGSVLFDLSLQYGMIKEVPGGYNSALHIEADDIFPEEGDPWYEYTFGGEAGPGLYSINDMTRRIEELEAKLAQAVEALGDLHQAVCGETGFSHCVRVDSGKAYPWPALDMADWQACATLAELKGQDDE